MKDDITRHILMSLRPYVANMDYERCAPLSKRSFDYLMNEAKQHWYAKGYHDAKKEADNGR